METASKRAVTPTSVVAEAASAVDEFPFDLFQQVNGLEEPHTELCSLLQKDSPCVRRFRPPC